MTKAMKTVHLYCPTTKKSVDNVVVSPFHSFEQVLQGVRLAVCSKYAALYTVDAKPILSVEAFEDDQHLLVAVSAAEVMLPHSSPDFVLYNGEEGDNVNPDIEGFGEAWENLTDSEKCEHITSLSVMNPTTRNRMRITRPYDSTASDLGEIEKAVESELTVPEYMTEVETNIESRWHMTYDHFIPSAHCPPRFKNNGTVWSPRVLAALDVLSSFTHGQARLAAEFLEEAIKMRIEEGQDTDMVVKPEDLAAAIGIIYEYAGVIPPKLTKKGGKRGSGKEKRKAARGKGKKGNHLTP